MVFIMRKILFYVVIGCMALTLAACGKKGGGGSAASKDYVYKAEEVEIAEAEDVDRFNDFYIRDGRIYFTTIRWLEESRRMTFVSMDMDGSDKKSFTLEDGANGYFVSLDSDKEGNYYAVYDEYGEEDNGDDGYSFWENYYLLKLSSTGTQAWKLPLNEKGQDYWVNWMRVLSDGRIAVTDQERISFYDTDGNPSGYVELKEEIGGGPSFLQDGRIFINKYDDKADKAFLHELNVNTGELSGEYSIPGASGNYSLYAGADSDLLLVGNGGVYAYNLGDTEAKKLMDFIDSDLSSSYIYNVCAVSEREFYAILNDEMTGEAMLMKFTKVDPKDVADKTVLTLACCYLDWNVRKQVVEFNKKNEAYRIQITDYSQYNTDEDYSAGITKLNTDIVSGKMPDILLLDSNLPVESYAAKGLFEDLYPYIDGDNEINREDYFPNVLKAFESNGKLYRLAPRFIIYTVAGKTADVGKRTGWTLQDLNEVMASKPEGTEVFSEMTRADMLYYSMRMSGSQFIDWESGKCDFNSDGFISLLAFIKSFPETLPDDYYDNALKGEWNSWLRKGNVLLDRMNLDSFSGYNYEKKGFFGEDITLIGFPSEDGKGSAINADLELAMSAKSKNKEGVWQFLRYFLMDEYQEKGNYGWPLSMKHVDAMAQEAKKRPSYEDENGNMVEYDETYYIDGAEVPISPMTQEEIEEVLAFVKSVERLHTNNQELSDIVWEETAPYFAGQKNAKEVANIIQNRVQIYVNENR